MMKQEEPEQLVAQVNFQLLLSAYLAFDHLFSRMSRHGITKLRGLQSRDRSETRKKGKSLSIMRIIFFGSLLSIAEKQIKTDVFDEGL